MKQKDKDASQRTIKYFKVSHQIYEIDPFMIVKSKGLRSTCVVEFFKI